MPPVVGPCSFCGSPAILRCARCKKALYCSQTCQKKDWFGPGTHRKECARLRQENEQRATNSVDVICSSDVIGSLHSSVRDGTMHQTSSRMSLPKISATDESLLQLPPSPCVDSSRPPVPSLNLFSYEEFIESWKHENSEYLGNGNEELNQMKGTRLSKSAIEKLPVPFGVDNLGNSCYASAVIQILFATRPFTASFRYGAARKHYKICRKRMQNFAWCPVCEFYDLVAQAIQIPTQSGSNNHQRSNSLSVNPRRLLRGIKMHGMKLNLLKQEDSHEFLVTLLNDMSAVMVRHGASELNADIAGLDDYTRATEPLLGYSFGCTIRHETNCLNCGAVSKRFSPDIGLVLTVPDSGHTSLEKLLEAYFSTEKLEGDNAYSCDDCNSKVPALKFNCIEVAPNVLQLCLKWYGFGAFSKRSSRVSFPEEIDAKPWLGKDAMDSGQNLTYSLFAVIQHRDKFGSTQSGHYVAFVRSRMAQDRWWCCDDDDVFSVSLPRVMSAQPYILLYERKEPREKMPSSHSSDTCPGKSYKESKCEEKKENNEVIESLVPNENKIDLNRSSDSHEAKSHKTILGSIVRDKHLLWNPDVFKSKPSKFVVEVTKISGDGSRKLDILIEFPQVQSPSDEIHWMLFQESPSWVELRAWSTTDLHAIIPLPVPCRVPESAKTLEATWLEASQQMHIQFDASNPAYALMT